MGEWALGSEIEIAIAEGSFVSRLGDAHMMTLPRDELESVLIAWDI